MNRVFSLIIVMLAAGLPATAQTRPAPPTQQKRVPPPKVPKRERLYILLAGGTNVTVTTLNDRFVHTVNAEEATTRARYPSTAGLLIDAGGGTRFWRNLGAAVHVSRSAIDGTARVDSDVPHPFFDDRDRQVSGDASDLTRTETAVHVQLTYERTLGRWRVRAGGGPSYFRLEQEVVTGVAVDEEYPYDTASFQNATTKRVRESAPGFNVGAEACRMFSRRFGLSGLVRYSRGTIRFNVDGTHRVSTDAGGAQVGAGLHISF